MACCLAPLRRLGLHPSRSSQRMSSSKTPRSKSSAFRFLRTVSRPQAAGPLLEPRLPPHCSIREESWLPEEHLPPPPHLPQRNSTIPPTKLFLRPAAWLSGATILPQRCFPAGRCSSPGDWTVLEIR